MSRDTSAMDAALAASVGASPTTCISVARAGTDELMPIVRRTHFQRELLTIDIEGGETIKALQENVEKLKTQAKAIPGK